MLERGQELMSEPSPEGLTGVKYSFIQQIFTELVESTAKDSTNNTTGPTLALLELTVQWGRQGTIKKHVHIEYNIGDGEC